MQRAQAQTGQGTQTFGHRDSSQTARLRYRARPQGFSAADRLRHSAEFRHLQRKGVRGESSHFILYVGKLPVGGRPRLGVTVSRRVGNAVVRNRIKRRIRECFRLTLRQQMPEGTSMVIIARPGAGDLGAAAIGQELGAAIPCLLGRLKQRLNNRTER